MEVVCACLSGLRNVSIVGFQLLQPRGRVGDHPLQLRGLVPVVLHLRLRHTSVAKRSERSAREGTSSPPIVVESLRQSCFKMNNHHSSFASHAWKRNKAESALHCRCCPDIHPKASMMLG